MMLSNVMNEYFKDINKKNNFTINENKKNPVKVKKTSWNKKEKSISKVFLIKNRKQKEAFVVEILKYLRESSCNIEFICKSKEVIVVIRALSPYISELELECSKDIDKIKKDITYYYAEK